MVEGYYTGFGQDMQSHINGCAECAALYRKLCEALDMASEVEVPPRGPNYGAELWERVAPRLPAQNPRIIRLGMAALAVAASFTVFTLAASFWHRNTAIQNQPIHSPELAINNVPALQHVQLEKEDAKLLALNRLLEKDSKKAVPRIIKMVKSDTSDKTRKHALFVLAQSPSPEAHDALLTFARQDQDPALETQAVRIIGVTGDEGSQRELAGLYQTSSNLAVKREILNGMMLSGSKTALLKVAQTEPDANLRSSAMANLSALSVKAQPATAYVLNRTDYFQKQQVLSVVFSAQDSQSVLSLLKQQPDPKLRAATVRSLAAMGGHSAVLKDIYREDHEPVVQQAVLDGLVMQADRETLTDLASNETDDAKKAEILRSIAAINPNQK